MTKIEINGVITEAEPGSTIIEVADKLAIPIPRFCYHSKLSVAANCRMCLVQIEKSPKPLPACATPIAEGMKIWTASKQAIDAQKSVMEFLLINHPLDCPICDQGGECELQDVSMQYGKDTSRYDEPKRVVLDQNLGPLVATDMTRCIQCTRCVRFGEEVSGERELGATGRSEHVEIGTFIEQNVNSEVSGNIIDLCPVGALTSKPFRFKARAWELNQYPSIAPHDCIGSNLYVHVKNNTVMRVVPKSTADLNDVWLSDRDRFSYEAVTHDDRLRKPMLFKNDRWNIVTWVEALKYAIAGIKLCVDNYGPEQFGVLASPNATIEEYYLLQKFARNYGSNNIDHRLRQLDFKDQNLAPLYPNLGIQFKDLETQDAILLVGSQLHKEQPIAGLKLRKMTLNGGKVCVINPVDFKFNFKITAKAIRSPNDMLIAMAGVAKELLTLNPQNKSKKFAELLSKITPTAEDMQIAATMMTAKKRQIILGPLALMHPQAAKLIALADLIAKIIGGTFGYFSDGANAAGAWLAGCLPHRLPGGAPVAKTGKNALEMLQTPLKCYILFAIEPEFDSVLGEQALQTLKQADFIVVLSSYQSQTLFDIADIVLPISAFAESAGTMVNIDGIWQSFAEIVAPFADSRPAWKVLRVLGSLAGFQNFDQESAPELLAEIKRSIIKVNTLPTEQCSAPEDLAISTKSKGLERIAPVALYATDSMVRRAKSLQRTQDAVANPTLQLNSQTAKNLNINHGSLVRVSSATGSINITTEINDRIADKSILIYQANNQTNSLGAYSTIVEVSLC